MPRLRNRKGAIAILMALMFVVLIAATGAAVDMSRMFMMKNQLQTAADAAAMAGAIELVRTPSNATAEVQRYATSNMVLDRAVGVPNPDTDIRFGSWNDATHTLTNPHPPAPTTADDAVRVTVSAPSSYLFMQVFGIPTVQIRASATAWARAPVGTLTECVKPWAIPYERLTNVLDPGNPDLQRELTEDDRVRLRQMSEADRTFTLKYGSDQTDGSGLPGNYYGVVLPAFWRTSTGQYVDPPPDRGGAAYESNISGCQNTPLQRGDSLWTEPGDKVGPTLQGARELCKPLLDGACYNAEGTIGVKMKSTFWSVGQSVSVNGRSEAVAVRLVGSFILTRIEENKDPNTGAEMAQVTGYFVSLDDPGQVTNTPTLLERQILVQ